MAAHRKDIPVDTVFDRWKVIGPDYGRAGYFQCICSCGTYGVVWGSSLRRGDSRSCGCLNRESLRAVVRIGNGNLARKNGTIEYFKCNTWNNIQKRTINGKPHPHFASYIRKGIECQMTKSEFYIWCECNSNAILDLYKQGEVPSVDRIDNEGHYCLSNIRILSHRENVRRPKSGASK